MTLMKLIQDFAFGVMAGLGWIVIQAIVNYFF